MTSSASNCKDPVWIDTPFWKTLPDDAKVYNFAYGANCCTGSIERRKLEPIESIPARLPGFQISFRMVGIPLVEPSFADVEETGDLTREIHGVCHLLSKKAWRRLQVSEGGQGVDRRLYVPHKVTCLAYDGREIEAYVLMSEPDSRIPLKFFQRYCAPSKRYVTKIAAGSNFGVKQHYVDAVKKSIPVTDPPMSHKIAVACAALPALPLFALLVAFRRQLIAKSPAVLGGMYRLIMMYMWMVTTPLVWSVPSTNEPIKFSVPVEEKK